MDVAEGKESQRPAEPELTFQRDGVRLAAERVSRLAIRKEPEAEGSPIMDDRANDGRGARMASGGGKGVRTLFSGLAEEESAPSCSFTAHSGTALRTPEGELTLRGTRGYSIDHDARHGPEPPKKRVLTPFPRPSNDHFRSSRTRHFRPSVSGEGTVDYQSTDAAFEQKFWGSFGESDTRSVQQGSNWRVPETTLVRSGQYGSGAANPLTRSSSGGHALDSGFYDGGFASWGYEGQAIHTRFDSAIGPGSPQSPATWDDSNRPDMGSGPNLLRQLQDGGGGGDIN
jgi:hypothetical protein